jgi:hypothetical protein
VSRRPYRPGAVFTPPISGPAPLGWHKWQWNGIEESISRRADPVSPENVETQADPSPTGPACAKREAA